ncbi:MAG: hypothetical protein ACQSGP_24670 [Frankia sp.]
MRWEALFNDLEMQWEAAEAADLAAEVADRTRREVARLRLVDRLRPCVGEVLRFGTAGTSRSREESALAGRLVALGSDWLLIEEQGGREVLVATAALLWVDGLSPASALPGHEGALARRLDLRYALRGLCRDRAVLAVTLVDGSFLRGLAHRVGADFLELVDASADGEPRWDRSAGAAGARAGRRVRTVTLNALAVVRSV